jgi:hypothetical protein
LDPEEAIQRAHRASFGEDSDRLHGFRVEPTDELTIERLMEWAVIETDPDLVRSTRRLGAPITWYKRFLRRMLSQELGQAYAQQSRFNLMVVTRLQELEDRSDPPSGPASGS